MKERTLFDWILLICGFIFLVYGITVLCIIGLKGIFNYFYFLAGVFFLSLEHYHNLIRQHISKKILKAVNICVLVFFISFTILEGYIISYSTSIPSSSADYVIVLGCLVKEDGPQKDFKERLNKAISYYQEYTDSTLVVTGGKGKNEPFSEADSAKEYLIENGIPEEKIISENKSLNTYENLGNVKNILQNEDVSKLNIVVVSSGYHLFRANILAHKLGYENISYMASSGSVLLAPHNYTREYFAMFKAVFIDGNF